MRQFLADLVRCLPEGMGLDPKRLMDWADPCPGNTPFSFSDEFKEELGCYLWRMVYIGLLHVIRDEKDRPLLVRTVLGNSVLNGKEIAPSQNDRMLVVQPNLEIMGDVINLANVGKDVAPFVEVVSAERTLLLRLSRDQVEKAIHAGYSVQNCVAALKQAATQPIAQNVFDTLEEWKRGYRRVYIRPAMLMQLDDEEQADVIRNGPLKKYIREEISPTVFRVLRNDLPDIRRILRRMKIHPVEKLRKKKGYSSAFRKKEYALKECMTPEYSSLGTFEPAEETLSKELSRYKISVYGAGMQHVNRKPRLTLTLGKMRSIVSEALHTRTPILIRLQKSDSGGTQEHVVLPIYWADQGRLLMISEEEDGKEFKLYLKDILEIQILSPEDGTGSRLF